MSNLFELQFAIDGVTFEQYPEGEIAIRLQHVVNRVIDGETEGTIYDTNGNQIGSWKYGRREDET